MTVQQITLQIIPVQGDSIGAASMLVVQHGLSTPVTLYTDATLTTTIPNPVAVDETGSVDFWVANDAVTYDGFLSGGIVIPGTSIVDLAAQSSPTAVPCYVPRYFTVDLVPQLGGDLGDLAVTVLYHNTSSPAPIYQDEALASQITNPFAMTSGYNISFWVLDGSVEYDVRLTGDRLVGGTQVIQNIWTLPAPIWANISTYWANAAIEWAYINPYPINVTKVQNVGQLYTANDLIRAAMRLIQVASVDTVLTAAELQDGLESLNRMIDSWSLDELMLYQVTREQFQLASGQNPYSIGYGGDWNTSRPTKIIGAYLTLNNGSIPVDYPMIVLNWDDYNAIRLKTLSTNFPGYIYYQPSFPLGEVYIYPLFSPNDPSTQGPAYITLTSWKPLDIIVDPTAYIELPPGYWEAIVFNLAVRIAEEYQFAIRPQTVDLAIGALKRIKRINQRTMTLQTDTALMNTSQMRYNIYSDSFGR
jgi:hypothetical protein